MSAVPADAPQPVGGHLDELRRRLLRMLIALAGTATGAFAFAPAIFRWLLRPYHRFLSALHAAVGGAMLQTLEPAETLKMSVQLALLVAAVLIFPYACYELWGFLRPGLTPKERRWLLPALGGGTGLFLAGVTFAYYLVLPIGLQFFWEYSLRLGITPAWSVAHYVGFVVSTLVAFGVAFELPLLVMGLTALGIVTPATLRAARRYAYFLIAVAAAVLTPPDAVSMLLMGIPLVALYELALLGSNLLAGRSM